MTTRFRDWVDDFLTALTGTNVDADVDKIHIVDDSADASKYITPKELIANSPSYTPTGTIAATTFQGAVDEIVSDLAASSGASLVGFVQSGTGAVARPVQSKERDFVSAFDFMAAAQIADVQAETLLVDVTTLLNTVLTALKARGGGRLFLPRGNYYCTSLVGNAPQTIGDVSPNTEIFGEKGTTLTFLGTYNGTLLCLNGNNVAIKNLKINSTRTIDHHGDLVAQRVVTQTGIIIGGKLGVGTTADYVTGVTVQDVEVTNVNVPITVTQASKVIVSDNIIDEFTDTGIVIQDCLTDISVERNVVTGGGDDCIFARVYSTSPNAATYAGRLHIKNNFLNDTFGKNIGVGGYGDVEISGNYCGLSWAGGINLEKDDWAATNVLNYRNFKIYDNTIVDAGRNWSTSETYAPHQVAATGYNPSGILTVYQNTRGSINQVNTKISGNLIVNPYSAALALSALDHASVISNVITPGSTNHGSGAVKSSAGDAAMVIYESNDISVLHNDINDALGVTFDYGYGVALGAGPISNIRFSGNLERVIIGVSYASDASSAAATFVGDIVGKNKTTWLAAAPTSGTWRQGDTIYSTVAAAAAVPGWICVTSGTFSTATDNTGDTDGSTKVITGLTDTSDFYVGQYVTVSAGFATTGPFEIVSLTSTTMTVDTASNSAQSNVTVATPDPTFKAMAAVAA